MNNKLVFLSIFTVIVISLAVAFYFLSSQDKVAMPISEMTSEPKTKVLATIFPLYDMVRQVGGDKVDTVLLLPPGSSPHTFEASPSIMKEIDGAKLMFVIGAGADDWAVKLADSVKVVDVSEQVALRHFDVHEEGSGHEDYYEAGAESEHSHQGLDPHYWLSPKEAKLMASYIATRLSLMDPANKDYFVVNANNFISRLGDRSVVWQERLGQLAQKDLIVFHDAWGYFADYFGLNVVASFEPFPGKTPSPAYLVELQEKVAEHSIKALFVEPQLSKEAITTMASDLGIKVEVLDPLGGFDGRDNYLALLDYNINTIIESLK